MRRAERCREPNAAMRARYDRDYAIFLAMHRQQKELLEMMK